MASPHSFPADTIDESVERDHETREYPLDFRGQTRGIKDGKEMVLDKAIRVSRLAGERQESIFQGRQGAHGARHEFSVDAPGNAGQVRNREPARAMDQQTSKQDVQYEEQVNAHDHSRQQPIGHSPEPAARRISQRPMQRPVLPAIATSVTRAAISESTTTTGRPSTPTRPGRRCALASRW